jgi:beta-1,4-N-acetylglucosaminyltransferase
MIFVTIGNAKQGFKRLLDAIDDLASKDFFAPETVLLQIGNNKDFMAHSCKQEKFLGMDEFSKIVEESNLVICHAGAGSLSHVFRFGKIPVVMPRRKKYNESIDDHQIEIVEELTAEGKIIPAYEPEDLPDAIKIARERNANGNAIHAGLEEKRKPMLDLVEQAIRELVK